MFYCTIYTSENRVNAKNKIFKPVLCLSYASKADASKMKASLMQQATKNGITILEDSEDSTTFYGAVFLSLGGFVPSIYGTNIYSVKIEDSDTRFLEISQETKFSSNINHIVKDGLEWEAMRLRHLKDIETAKIVEEEKINQNISNFEAEIEGLTDLHQILKIFLKYAAKKIDKEKLITILVRKIQNEPKQKTSDWYDELSNMNI